MKCAVMAGKGLAATEIAPSPIPADMGWCSAEICIIECHYKTLVSRLLTVNNRPTENR